MHEHLCTANELENDQKLLLLESQGYLMNMNAIIMKRNKKKTRVQSNYSVRQTENTKYSVYVCWVCDCMEHWSGLVCSGFTLNPITQ